MKLTPDDPVLTAYALGELDSTQRDLVSQVVAADESLQEEEAAISSMAGLLGRTLGREPLTLGDERIAEIHRACRRPDSKVLVMEHRKRARRQSLSVVAGVAAMIVIGFVVLSQFEVDGKPAVAGGEVAGGGTSPGNAPAPGDSSDLPGGFSPVKTGMTGLPLQARQQADPSLVERSIEETGKLPTRDEFLVAQWIHLAKVDSVSLTEVGNLGMSYELGPCSWNPSASLLMIHLRPLQDRAVTLEANLNFNLKKVNEAKLTGGAGTGDALPVTSTEIRKARTFLYELDLSEGTEQIGSLTVKVGEDQARELLLEGPVRDKEDVSTAFQVAGILGDYARWGASEGRDRETLVRLVREARELLGTVVDESTRYALDMILISEEALAAE